MSSSWRSTFVALLLVAGFADASFAQYLRTPPSGSVYREYAISTGGQWRVNDPGATDPDAQALLPNPKISISIGDLAEAVRAELVVDMWGGHPGTSEKRIRFNNNAWIDVPRPGFSTTQPECYMHQPNLVIDIPLSDLVQGANLLEGTAGPQICNNFNWGQWGWFQVAVRVYYDASKPHPTGAVTSPAAGATFGENPTITASATSSAGVDRVEFFAYYEGYDRDGDGRFLDWQESYHRPKSATTWTLAGHVGTDTTAPYSATWDTSWVPDQAAGQIKFLARIRDTSGMWFVTDEIAGLTLLRQTTSVRLYRAFGIPTAFWVRAGQSKSCSYFIPTGDDLSLATAAQVHISTWNGSDNTAVMRIGTWTAPRFGADHHHSFNVLTLPVSALVQGLNTFTVSATTTAHGPEILWPGPAILVKYNDAPRGPTVLPAAYGFEEGAGSNVIDASGNGNNGAIAPNASRTTSGRFGSGIAFDGTSGYVDLDTIDVGGSALTVSMWVYPQSDTLADARLAAKARGLSDIFWVVGLNSQRRVRFELKTTTGGASLFSAPNLTLDAWNHVAVTYDGAQMRIFINGAQSAVSAKTGNLLVDNTVPVWLGDIPGPDRKVLRGRIDEVRIYGIAQTSTQIAADRDTPIGGMDSTAPSVPTNLQATAVSPTAIDLSWSASTDNVGVAEYRVSRNGVFLSSVPAPGLHDSGLTPSTTYSYTVVAVDSAGNLSGASAPASATTLAVDTTPPSAPTGVSATALSAAAISVSWNPATDNIGVAEYVVVRNGVRIATVPGTSYADSGLAASTTYTYTVIAVDTSANESTESAPASATTGAAGEHPWQIATLPWRFGVDVDPLGTARTDATAEVDVNLTSLLALAGESSAVDPATIRVVEVDATGIVLNGTVVAQFDPAATFNASTNAAGTLLVLLAGTTPANTVRYFDVYLGPPGSSAPPSSPTPRVTVTTGVVDEDRTPSASIRSAAPGGTTGRAQASRVSSTAPETTGSGITRRVRRRGTTAAFQTPSIPRATSTLARRRRRPM